MNNSSIFTLDRKGKGFDIEEYPDGIYVDTSVWNTIYGSNNTSKTKTLLTDFMGDCLDHNVKFYSSGVVHEELTHIIREDMMRQEFDSYQDMRMPKYQDGKPNFKARDKMIIERNPSIVGMIDNTVEEAISFVNQASEFLPYEETEELTKTMIELIKRSQYLLDTRDVKHVLAAHTYDLNSILTCDGDYFMFDNLNVYAPPNDRYVKEKIGRANVLLSFEKSKY